MAEPAGSNGNTLAAPVVGVLNDVWDQASHSLRSGTGVAATAATLSNVTSSATVVTLVAANTSRKDLLIFNESTAVLYVKFGSVASTSSYTVQLPANGYFEITKPVYQGIVTGIWAAANGFARITEIS